MRETFAASLRRQRLQTAQRALAPSQDSGAPLLPNAAADSHLHGAPERNLLPQSQIPPIDRATDTAVQTCEGRGRGFPQPPPARPNRSSSNCGSQQRSASHRLASQPSTNCGSGERSPHSSARRLKTGGEQERDTSRSCPVEEEEEEAKAGPGIVSEVRLETEKFMQEMQRKFSQAAIDSRAFASQERVHLGEDALFTFDLIVESPLAEVVGAVYAYVRVCAGMLVLCMHACMHVCTYVCMYHRVRRPSTTGKAYSVAAATKCDQARARLQQCHCQGFPSEKGSNWQSLKARIDSSIAFTQKNKSPLSPRL